MFRQTVFNYYRLGLATHSNMDVRTTEFVTEVILSLFILTITIEKPDVASLAVPSIAIIHSLNVARAMEAYRDAKQDKPRLSDYGDD